MAIKMPRAKDLDSAGNIKIDKKLEVMKIK